MKVFILAISLTIATAKECTKTKPVAEAAMPGCIRQKIDSIKAQPKWNPPAEVWEYSYNGKTVYYFSGNCCDQYNMIYDSHCNYVCAPSGGLTGKGDRKCPDFDATAKKIKLVWKDDR